MFVAARTDRHTLSTSAGSHGEAASCENMNKKHEETEEKSPSARPASPGFSSVMSSQSTRELTGRIQLSPLLFLYANLLNEEECVFWGMTFSWGLL